MNHSLRSLIALSCLVPASAWAEVNLYGRANVSLEQVEKGQESFHSLESNASRIGLKGTEKIADAGIEAVYKIEYEAYVDDGDDGKENALKQRDIYVGVKGEYGTVIAGNFDTPLKTSQNKVDLFNDLRGDINKFITTNDLRAKNSVMYSTPKFAGGFTGYVDVISSEADGVDDGSSLALAYDSSVFYAALAYDTNVAAVDTEALRLVGQLTLGSFQFGALFDQNTDAKDNETEGWIVSAQYSLAQWAFKAQYGQSDIRQDGDVVSLGVDYKLSKTTKVYGFFTTEQADATLTPKKAEIDNSYAGVGLEMNF
jgi:predicted porin